MLGCHVYILQDTSFLDIHDYLRFGRMLSSSRENLQLLLEIPIVLHLHIWSHTQPFACSANLRKRTKYA